MFNKKLHLNFSNLQGNNSMIDKYKDIYFINILIKMRVGTHNSFYQTLLKNSYENWLIFEF